MLKLHRLALTTAVLMVPVFASAQSVPASSAEARARVIAASFNKSKHVSKEKRGIRKEKWLEITSKPAVNANPAAYSGTYQVEGMGFSLNLRVAPDGTVQGTGYDLIDSDSNVKRPFTLTNARVQGALIAGTKKYENGASQKFEGVFIDRTTKTSPTDPGRTEFGLGVMGDFGYLYGVTLTRLFYQLAPGSGR
jgi:hypothetical protein